MSDLCLNTDFCNKCQNYAECRRCRLKELYLKGRTDAIDEFLKILLKRNAQNINDICKAQFCEGDCIKCEKEYMNVAEQLK